MLLGLTTRMTEPLVQRAKPLSLYLRHFYVDVLYIKIDHPLSGVQTPKFFIFLADLPNYPPNMVNQY